jgi:hypothetical protein
MLLQIMEEGHLSDARGRKVDFRNALIVMTSNVGADMIKRQTSLGFDLKRDEELEERLVYQEMRRKLIDSLKRVFRPEFINRVDAVIVFRSLNKESIRQIVQLEINKVAERVEEHDIVLNATPAALDALADMGYDLRWAPARSNAPSSRRWKMLCRMPCWRRIRRRRHDHDRRIDERSPRRRRGQCREVCRTRVRRPSHRNLGQSLNQRVQFPSRMEGIFRQIPRQGLGNSGEYNQSMPKTRTQYVCCGGANPHVIWGAVAVRRLEQHGRVKWWSYRRRKPARPRLPGLVPQPCRPWKSAKRRTPASQSTNSVLGGDCPGLDRAIGETRIGKSTLLPAWRSPWRKQCCAVRFG